MKKLWKKIKLKRRVVTALAAMHFYGNPSRKLKIVGVTGTSGKTTTVTLLYRIAKALGYKAGLISTVENIIDGEVFPATHTTPDPIHLNKILSQMVDKGCEYVFMEVSSHAMDQKRVSGVNFAGGIFTNLTHDHLDYHKSVEEYFLAKKKFFKVLPTDAFALSNTDDEHGKMMLEGIKARASSYGFDGGVDFKGVVSKLDFSGLELVFNGQVVRSKLIGKFNAYNLLSVWSASQLLGFDTAQVNKILENIEPPRGRFEHFTSANGVMAIVDYAHKPDALAKVFLPIKDVVEKNKTKGIESRIISVFGCGGDRDPLKRRVMGKIGAEESDIAIFTSDNPRGEDPDKIIEMMKIDLSMNLVQKVKTFANRREAINEAVKLAKPGDIILCAGKGHETYQEIKGVKHHFDDMEELREAFAKVGSKTSA